MDRRRFLRAGLLGLVAASCAEPATLAPSPASTPRATPERSPPAAPTTPAATTGPSPSPDPSPEPPPAEPSPAAEPLALDVLCRDAWGGVPPGQGLVAHDLSRLTLHHSAVVLGDNRDAPSRLRQHQRHHREQGWPDIAYHVGIDRNGNLYDLRPHGYRGDTFTAYDPAGHYLVLCEGNFDRERPTDAQLEGAAAVLAWASAAFAVPLQTLTGHRDWTTTSCPGDHLYAQLGAVGARAGDLLARGVRRVEICGPEGTQAVAAIEAGRR